MSKWITFFLLVVVVVVLAGCGSSSTSKIAFSAVSDTGDAKRGEELFTRTFNKAPACSTCHTMDDKMMTGPGLGPLKERAATRVQGQSAREYIFRSIVEPGSYLVTGFSNVMYPEYDEALSPQDISDLIEYLLNP